MGKFKVITIRHDHLASLYQGLVGFAVEEKTDLFIIANSMTRVLIMLPLKLKAMPLPSVCSDT